MLVFSFPFGLGFGLANSNHQRRSSGLVLNRRQIDSCLTTNNSIDFGQVVVTQDLESFEGGLFQLIVVP